MFDVPLSYIFSSIQDSVALVGSNTTVTGMIASMGNNYSVVNCPVNLCLTQFVAHELQMNFRYIQNANATCTDSQEM